MIEMRELRIAPTTPPVKVFNANPADAALSQQAIFVVPYQSPSGQNRVEVSHCAVVYEATVVPGKGLRQSFGLDGIVLKDFELTSTEDPQRQTDGYLSLIRMTNGQPITVASIDAPNFGLETLKRIIWDTYLVNFGKENAEQLASSMHEKIMRAYDPRSILGLSRRLLRRPVTATV